MRLHAQRRQQAQRARRCGSVAHWVPVLLYIQRGSVPGLLPQVQPPAPHTAPWASTASPTFRKAAMFAPAARLVLYSAAAPFAVL